jgi:hypothetical protein
MYEDEDNDGRFPDESPVEVRHLRSKQEEQGERGGPDDPFHDGGRGLRSGRLRGGGFSPHIYGLGRVHGQDGTAARMLPLSVDASLPPRSCCCTRHATTAMRRGWPGSCCGSASAHRRRGRDRHASRASPAGPRAEAGQDGALPRL